MDQLVDSKIDFEVDKDCYKIKFDYTTKDEGGNE